MTMTSLSSILCLLASSLLVLAQTCDNFGSTNTTAASCVCPPGFGGSDCSLAACGGTLFQGTSRQYSANATSGLKFSNISSCACQDGWGGFGCNVCTSSNACQSGYTSVFGSSNSSSMSLPGASNDTIVCNTKPRIYSAGELSCNVQNPTLSAIYPGDVYLNIIRTYNSSYALASGLTSYGSSGSIHAELFYEGEEQFFCQAGGCTVQSNDASSNWTCSDLECHCRAGAAMCGATPATDLSGAINTLTGTLGINCDSSSCTFQEQLLDQLFGSSGLSLSDCTFGECVRQSVIDYTSGDTGNGSQSGDGGSSLSGGVIAGIAVVGALVLAALLLILVGWLSQRKARAGGAAFGGSEDKLGPGIGLRWSNVSLHVENTPRWTSSFGAMGKSNSVYDGSRHKRILSDVSGHVAPGTMLAILGPSGAGKTSLVDILSGQEKRGMVTGEMRFFDGDGQSLEGTGRRARIGYVDQADVLPGTLTVYEALLFAARLRLPESVPLDEKRSHAMRVMEQLGLSGVADTRIGDERHRGLSGGERRRVSIGLELVARPDVLILDEPTSGLDSFSALKVANVLRSLAHDPSNSTAIIASIHQPSSHLYSTFDSVLLLADGRELYFGPGGTAPAETMAQRGYAPCPTGYSVPDHLLNLASDPEARSNSDLPVKPVESLGSATSYPPPSAVPRRLRGGNERKDLPYAATALTQFEVLCGREWKNLMRDKSLFLTHILVSIVLGVFCGGLYYQTGTTIAGFQSRIGCLFFLGSLLAFSSLSALFNLMEVRSLFLRERSGRYYHPAAWLSSRIVFDIIPLRLIPTIIVGTIVYWMAGLAPFADRFFKYLFILVLYSLAMTQFNFALAALFRNGGIAILLSSLWNLFMMTYAGFFVHLSSIPPVLRWLQYFSVLKYCLEALAVNEITSGLSIQDTLEGVPVNVDAVVIMKLLFGFQINAYYRDALVLFAFIGGFAVIGFAVIFAQLKERR